MKNPQVAEDNGKKLSLPPYNPLIPKSFDIFDKKEEHSKQPFLLKKWEDSQTELWYKKDDKFERPKAIVSLQVYTNDCMYGPNPKARVFVHLWEEVFQEYFREFVY
jgi:secreted Zn-dependent insulinase-like peptidase